jgi:hypothetical protein
MDTGLLLYIAWGFCFIWSLAFLYAFFMTSASTLNGMINGTFTLQGIGWSAFCALLALIPLWIVFWSWQNLQGYLPR